MGRQESTTYERRGIYHLTRHIMKLLMVFVVLATLFCANDAIFKKVFKKAKKIAKKNGKINSKVGKTVLPAYLLGRAKSNSGGEDDEDEDSSDDDSHHSSYHGSGYSSYPSTYCRVVPSTECVKVLRKDCHDVSGTVCHEVTSEEAMSYLTSKLVADSLMWRETFRNDSPSPEPLVSGGQAEQERDRGRQSPPTTLDLEVGRTARMLDQQVLADVEVEARRLASEVDSLVELLSASLHSISGLSVDTVELYRDGVCGTCEQVDNNIRAMYQLMAKWEELNKNMAPAHRLAQQIKDIKRLLDMFETSLA